MLHRVIGVSGSGKTEYILKNLGEAIKKGNECIVIVPEQQSVHYEGLLCERFGDGVNLSCEVLNFERLPNRIAREYGNLAVNNIDKGGACALLSLVAESLKDEMKEYSSVACEPDFASSVYALISRMKMARITPNQIEEALNSGELSEETRILSKLHDISLIYSEYEKNLVNELRDPRDALTLLADELDEKPFFKKKYVFIDGYYSFTEQEYQIIESIIAQSHECFVSFTIGNDRSFFDENAKSAKRILALAHNVTDDYYTGESKRFESDYLKLIENNLWKSNADKISGDDKSVRLITAKNRFDEIEAAASVILEFVRNGGRYRDITLLTGNSDAYMPIVESVFSRADIPVYTSSKESLVAKPLFSFLLASLAVVCDDFSLLSVKRYVKSGYTDLTLDESDILLNYAASWKLRGKAWYSEEEWALNPDGYSENDITDRGVEILKIANDARERIVAPLTDLRDNLKVKNLTVSKCVRALYAHLIAMQADEKLRKNAEYLLKIGKREESDREIQLWKLLINIFDQLDNICGEMPITIKRMQSLIKIMCDCYSLGAIPASGDAVTFGDASLIRAGGSKLVIVAGVCDGEFPASTQNSGFFDREEASVLESVGLSISDTMEKQLNVNRFFVYAAFSAPTQKLVLLCPKSELAGGDLRESTAWLSVKNMLPDVKEEAFDVDNCFYSRESVISAFPSLKKGEIRDKIEEFLKSNGDEYFETRPDVSDTVARISFDDTTLNLSPSKFEKYALCPFSFFGSYLLKLKEKKINEFSMPEIGNFVHKILDQFMRECCKTGSFVAPTESDRKDLIVSLSKQYFLDVIGKTFSEDKSFLHVYENTVKTIDFVAESLVKEFTSSKFTPVGFEFKIGLKGEDIPAISYDVEGKTVYLRGSIDRVDTYEVDGVKYVRVIDYKTYQKTFSADLVEFGIDTQMLHYLYAYCDNQKAKPAGVLYYTVKIPNVKIKGTEDDENIKNQAEKVLKRSGIVLNDVPIVQAMSPDMAYVPVEYSTKQDKLYTRGQSKRLYTDADFDELKVKLLDSLRALSKQVFCGNMDVSPLDNEKVKNDPCKYCAYGDMCRSKKEREEDDDDAEYDESDSD